MSQKIFHAFVATMFTLLAQTASAGQFVVELPAPLGTMPSDTQPDNAVVLQQSFAASEDSYAVFEADTLTALKVFLANSNVSAEKISEVLFVNRPEIGGGTAAGEMPRDGHQVFVIERPIPGVGFFGLDKKKKISKGSNKAIAKLGEIIEWDHSYLTSEGTYCVYRADSPETLQEHGALAGAPIGKITPVDHKSY